MIFKKGNREQGTGNNMDTPHPSPLPQVEREKSASGEGGTIHPFSHSPIKLFSLSAKTTPHCFALKRKAFTLAEMMVVMLVLSIILAASMPIITRRTKISADVLWKQTSNNPAQIYYGDNSSNAYGVAIGIANFDGVANEGRLLISTGNATQDAITFKQNTTTTGRLALGASNNISLGYNANASGANAYAAGTYANAYGDYAVALCPY